MPKSEIYTRIEGQDLKLTSLEKMLYPAINVTKAEVIQYYLDVHALLLNHIRYRPLTLIRYPNGIDQTSFYAKSKPTWTPDWIQDFTIKHTEEEISYLTIANKASVAWMANLSALEIHPMQFSSLEKNPDHFIFDLDPPEDFLWKDMLELSFDLKSFFESHGYVPFVKTSGGKGLHIYVPIKAKYGFEEMISSVKKMAKEFVGKNAKLLTLNMSKERRKGRVLLDIYRNHKGQTTVAPYSLRAKKEAPISMPVAWNDLVNVKSSQEYTINNYKKYIAKSKEAWAEFSNYASELHDQKTSIGIDLNSNLALKEYQEKRNFEISIEPQPRLNFENKNRYVIQLHDASNLHYDLRLEMNGVLWSWALPKGLPIQTDEKRLAIRTENHPVDYLNFEGTIAQGEYGAGTMWIVSKGTYTGISKSKTSIKFEIELNELKKTFSLFQTDSEQWMIKLLNGSSKLDFVIPMSAEQENTIPNADQHYYEIKWDGIRSIVIVNNEDIKIYSKSGRDISEKFPELIRDRKKILLSNGIYDGEIVCLNNQGKPLFNKVISRLHTIGKAKIDKNVKLNPAHCYLFDIINLDGYNVCKEPFVRRRQYLQSTINPNGYFRISEMLEDGEGLFQAVKEMQLEGIMAKKKNGYYFENQRSIDWIKVKVRNTEDCHILGYTKGKGDRSNLFGSLHLAIRLENGNWEYKGRVGTGFDHETMQIIFNKMNALIKVKSPLKKPVEKEGESVWIEVKMCCEVKFASLTPNGTYREPVFVKLIEN